MSSNDYIRIAVEIRAALAFGRSFTIPLMTIADLGQVLTRLKTMDSAA